MSETFNQVLGATNPNDGQIYWPPSKAADKDDTFTGPELPTHIGRPLNLSSVKANQLTFAWANPAQAEQIRRNPLSFLDRDQKAEHS
jgi:hypothetical protein